MKAIKELCGRFGFEFKAEGEVGFARSCTGILDPRTECWVAYEAHGFGGDPIMRVNYEIPIAPDAYHKGPYMAVLHHSRGGKISVADATSQLEAWCQRLLDADVGVMEFQELDVDATLEAGYDVMITQRCLVTK